MAALIKYRVKPEYRLGIEDYMRGDLYLIEFNPATNMYVVENKQGRRIKVAFEFLRDCMYQVMPEL